MNSHVSKLVTAVAVAVVGMAGAACAQMPGSQSEAQAGTRTLQPILPQGTAGVAATPGTSGATSATRAGLPPPPAPDTTAPPADTSSSTSTTSTATMPSTATSGPATAAPSGTSAENGQARRIFDQLDTNHDGVLSFQEFSRATFESK